MTESCSPTGGLSGPPLLSVSALSDAAECEIWVDNRAPLCRPKADDREDDCVGRCCCGGDREGLNVAAEVFGGDRRRRDGTP